MPAVGRQSPVGISGLRRLLPNPVGRQRQLWGDRKLSPIEQQHSSFTNPSLEPLGYEGSLCVRFVQAARGGDRPPLAPEVDTTYDNAPNGQVDSNVSI